LTLGDATFEQEIYAATGAPCRDAGLKRQPDCTRRVETVAGQLRHTTKPATTGAMLTVSCSDILVLEDQQTSDRSFRHFAISGELLIGLEEISAGVTLLDHVTHHKAAVAEQKTTTAGTLRQYSNELVAVLSQFQLPIGSAGSANLGRRLSSPYANRRSAMPQCPISAA
jgi:hypothetical protein